ncbi:MAG: hypothetical protein ACRDWE_00645, partial [Acidimicrobiales bacterium]
MVGDHGNPEDTSAGDHGDRAHHEGSGDCFARASFRLGRLPAPARAELDEPRAALYDEITGGTRANGPFPLVDREGHLLGPFAAMLADAPVGDALQRLGLAIRSSRALSD